MSYRYQKRLDDQTFFIVVVLLAGTVWAHQSLMLRVERIGLTAALVITGVIIVVNILKYIKRCLSLRNRHNSTLTDIDQMSGLEFERYVARLLEKQGYKNISLTEKYDYGVDIIAEKDGLRFGIQVKRYNGLVGASSVRQVVAALKIYDCDKAMVITNSTFSEVAICLADSNNCILNDRSKLIAMVK